MTTHDHDRSSHTNGDQHEHEHGGGFRGWVAGALRPHSHDTADSVDNALESSAEGIRAVKLSLVALGVTALVQATACCTNSRSSARPPSMSAPKLRPGPTATPPCTTIRTATVEKMTDSARS